jgi:hypothetical protein
MYASSAYTEISQSGSKLKSFGPLLPHVQEATVPQEASERSAEVVRTCPSTQKKIQTEKNT